MKHILFFTLLVFSSSLLTKAQSIKWVKELKATSVANGGQIVTDLKGNAYGTGGYTGTLTLAPTINIQSGTAHLPSFTSGIDTANGNALWASEIRPVAGCGCNYGDNGSVLEFDNSGNFLVAGYFCNCGTMAFGTQTLSALSHQTYLAKYDKTGHLLWVKTKADMNNGTGSAVNVIKAITTDEFDNIYLSIYSNLSANFAGLTIGKGIYLVKIDANGNGIWAKSTWDFVSNPNDGLYINKLQYINNRLYAASRYKGNFSFGGQTFSSNNSYFDVSILKMDTASNIISLSSIVSPEEDSEFSLQLLPNSTLVYVGLTTKTSSGASIATLSIGTNTYTTNNSYTKYYFVKLDTSLNVVSYKNFNANADPSYYMSHDLNNNIYLNVSNYLTGNNIDGATMATTGTHIVMFDQNLNGSSAIKTMGLGFSVDKDACIYVATPTTSTSITGFGTTFTPSGPEPYSQFLIKLGPMVVTGIGNTSSRTSNAQVYPNPSATGMYNLKISENIKQKHNIQITLTNNIGQAFNNITYTIENNQTLQVNLSNFASGLYNITAIIDGKSYSAKLEKE